MIEKSIKKKYIVNPDNCPYCGGGVSGENFEASFNQVWRRVVCNVCPREWIEIFTLTDIKEK